MRITVWISTIAVTLAVSAFLIAADGSQVNRHVEDFTTASLLDSAGTTALWDTAGAVVRMGAYQPSFLDGDPTADFSVEVALDGDRAFVAASQAGLWSFDISDPSNPVFIDSVITDEQIRDVDIAGDFAYVANVHAGLFVIDISDPGDPVFHGRFDTIGQTQALDVEGDYAYLADGPRGLTVIDISDPANPVEVANWDDGGGYGQHVRVAGDYAYLAHWFKGIRVLDVSDPTNPFLVSDYDTPSWARYVAIDGDVLYLCDSFTGLMIFDIGDPTSIQLKTTIDLPGLTRGVTIDGDYAYVADHADGMHVFDVTNPWKPTLLTTYGKPGGGYCHALEVADGIAYMGGGPEFTTVRIGERLVPAREVAQASFLYPSGPAVVDGDAAFVPAFGQLAVVDVSDPESPFVGGQYTRALGEFRDVALHGDYAFVTSGHAPTLEVLDISSPFMPTGVDSLTPIPNARRLLLDGNELYVFERGTRIVSIDISNPAAPVTLDTLDIGGVTSEVLPFGDLVIVADESILGYKLVDIADPSNLSLAFAWDGSAAGWPAANMARHGNLLYLGTEIIDITDPMAPVHVGSTGIVGQRTIDGDALFAPVAENAYAQRYDITSPLAPILIDEFGFGSEWLTVWGDYVLATGEQLGLTTTQVKRRIDPARNVARSLGQPGVADDVIRSRVASTYSGDVSWRISADGANWQVAPADFSWQLLATPGPSPRWEATLNYDSTVALPYVDEVEMEWLYAAPTIQCVTDVPGDPGGAAILQWRRSGHDFNDAAPPVDAYTVFRAAGGGEWDSLLTVNAVFGETYSTIVPTLGDSTAAFVPYTTYRVVAKAGGMQYASAPDSGYSLDNLAPGPPAPLTVSYGGAGNYVVWTPPIDPDVVSYRVYRDDTPVFAADSTTFVHATTDTSWSDATPGTYYYKVTAIDDAGLEGNPASMTIVSSAGDGDAPARTSLAQNVPNPFNPSTRIRYDVAATTGRVTLRIYDVRGRLVRSLVDTPSVPGSYTEQWDGTNDRGSRVASGIYFYRLRAPGFSAARKMLLLE